MSNAKLNSTNTKLVPLNESGTRTHQTPSTSRLETKQPPKSK